MNYCVKLFQNRECDTNAETSENDSNAGTSYSIAVARS